MKYINNKPPRSGLRTLAGLALLTAFSAGAATPLNPQVVSRPLTPGDKTN